MQTSLPNKLIMLAAVAGSLAGCHSTQLAATWHDPTAGPLHFNKTVVAFATTDESLRRTVEDKLVQKVPNSVQSYKLVPSAKEVDSSSIRRKFAEAGFDGALIMRVANVDPGVVYADNTYWSQTRYGFGYSWGNAWGYPYDPAYYYGDVVVALETDIYALADDRLVFAARSETTNPRSVGKLTDSVIKHVMNRLRKDGMIAGFYCKDPACTTFVGGN
jgi:hypothetical protein